MSKSISEAIKAANKRSGEGKVAKLKEYGKGTSIERLKSGVIGIDYITGGGYPKGRLTIINGWESSGKSTLAMMAMAKAQKEGKVAVYVEHEYTFDKKYAESLGVNTDELVISQPDTIEEGYAILEELLKSEDVGCAVFDSISAALTQKEVEGEMGDSVIGVKAKLNSSALSKFNRHIHNTGAVLIMINQLREKIGVVFGSPVTEPGGNALKFYPSVKIEVRQSTKDKDKSTDEVTGNLIKAKCTKNKTSPPFREAEYNIIYGEGISRELEIIHYGVEFGIIDKSGSWFSYSGTKLGQGVLNVKNLLKDNPELTEELEGLIYEVIENK